MTDRRMNAEVLYRHLQSLYRTLINRGLDLQLSTHILLGTCLLAKRLLDQADAIAIQDVTAPKGHSPKGKAGKWRPIQDAAKPVSQLKDVFAGLLELPEGQQYEAFSGFLRDLSLCFPGYERFLVVAADYELSRRDARGIATLLDGLSSFKFNDDSLESPRVVGQAFFALMEDNLQRSSGEFSTPEDLVQLMAGLIDPRGVASLADPFIGTGRLAARCALAILDGGEPHAEGPRVYGQERQSAMWVLSQIGLSLLGVDSCIQLGDTFLEPHLETSGMLDHFDLVVSDPPMGIKFAKVERLREDPYLRFGPNGPANECGPLEHMLASTKDGGQVIALVPPNVLYSQGRGAQVRKNWIQKDWIEAVISLPPGFLAPHTAMGCAVLVMRKGKGSHLQDHREAVLMIQGEVLLGTGRTRGKRTLSAQDRSALLDAFRRGEDGPFIRVASLAEVLANDGDLQPSRYLADNASAIEEREDLDVVLRRLASLDEAVRESGQRLDALIQKFISNRA